MSGSEHGWGVDLKGRDGKKSILISLRSSLHISVWDGHSNSPKYLEIEQPKGWIIRAKIQIKQAATETGLGSKIT